VKYNLEIPDLVLSTMPSGSTRLTVAFIYSLPSIVLKSSASAIDADGAEADLKKELNVGRSLAADRRRKAKTKAAKGQGGIVVTPNAVKHRSRF
jgi:hypothetical protein